MFFGGSKRGNQAAKWTIQVVTACILVYLGIRHMDAVAGAVIWLADLFEPLLLGIVLALVLNVPMCPIEKHLFQKKYGSKAQKARRGTAIVLSLLLIFSIILGVAFLVIPEILDAIPLVSDNILHLVGQIDFQDGTINMEHFSVVKLLSQFDIDWSGIKASMSNWFMASRSTVMNYVMEVVAEIGMFFLRLPYAPMVGDLVGVTALIPIVGAWTGTIVGAFIILTVDPFKAFVFVVFFVILQQVEGNVIYPRVVGSSIGLSAIWVLAAITVGGRLAGPIGMFIGVPAASALYTLLKEATIWKEHRPPKEKRKILTQKAEI